MTMSKSWPILLVLAGIVCLESEAQPQSAPTYYKDIAPIFEEHCVTCHRPGEVAPMSLMEYGQIRPWAKSIQEQVVKKIMPPFHATGPIGHYKDDLRLTDDQIALVSVWVDKNCPKGNPADFTRTKDWTIKKWPAGEPDYIVKFPRLKIMPASDDPYVYLFALEKIPEKYWVRGFAWHFDQRKYAHHAIAYELTDEWPSPPGFIFDGHKVGFPFRPGGAGGADYLPGSSTHFFAEGSAVNIPKDARLYAIFHYAPTEETIWDQPELGFYFADGNVPKPSMRLSLSADEIVINPGVAHYEQKLTTTFSADAYVFDYQVHMHNRGKSATVNFHYPDGTSERVFHMPQFNFDWQRRYYLTSPKFVPKDTVAEFVAVWDNSADNPFNPDPTATVEFGVFTHNEMGNVNLTITGAGKSDALLIVENGVEVDLVRLKTRIEGLTESGLADFIVELTPEQIKGVRAIWDGKQRSKDQK
jgi:mono/diheme cytochrome c family protein